ncbi:MAG: hypothetical protein LAP61_06850 [Acidobacteriia bacterium]|nr:hypothetical protein [Terriglobia bacterium]
MHTNVEWEFSHLSTDDLMKAYASAIEASALATGEMIQKAEPDGFRAARLRVDYCRQACDDLREALSLRIAGHERIQSLGE